MNNATVTIQGIESKSGVSKAGKAWTKFTVETSAGKFSTFDSALADQARNALNMTAVVTYEESHWQTEEGETRTSKDLKSLTVDPTATPQPHVEAPPAVKPDGSADWDLIGLRKTRCAPWVAAIGAGLSAAGAQAMVLEAEVDIFWRKPAEADSLIPF